jgi:hypothetical protein
MHGAVQVAEPQVPGGSLQVRRQREARDDGYLAPEGCSFSRHREPVGLAEDMVRRTHPSGTPTLFADSRLDGQANPQWGHAGRP